MNQTIFKNYIAISILHFKIRTHSGKFNLSKLLLMLCKYTLNNHDATTNMQINIFLYSMIYVCNCPTSEYLKQIKYFY